MKLSLLSLALSLALCPLFAANPAVQEVSGLEGHTAVAAPVTPAEAQPKNIILMIGDGMGLEQLCLGRITNKGPLSIEQLPVTGFSRTPSASHMVTDSAAGGTAFACGTKAINGQLGQTPEGENRDSLLALAVQRGMAGGLVVTKDITDATPAAFYAHVPHREQAAEIAAFLPGSGARFVRGGGMSHFTEEQLAAMRAAGMDIELTAPKHMPPASARGDVLVQDTARALEVLSAANEKGFFLMVEGSQIDTAGHANDLREVACEMLDFDKAVGVVMEWMQSHPDTLLVVTADHQTGGLSLLSGDMKEGTVKGAFSTGSHNGIAVPVYAAGAGAAAFMGFHENTELFSLLKAAMEKNGATR